MDNSEVNSEEIVYNRAKIWQLFLFSFNNLSTNMFYVVLSAYFLYYSQNFLAISAIIVGFLITGMRLFDGITDPIIGFLIDRTNTKFGKFRPWMFIGNTILIITFLMMFNIDPNWNPMLKITVLVSAYAVHIIGYSMQTACTKGAISIITNDPKQRPLMAMFDGVIGMVFIGLVMGMIPAYASTFEKNLIDPQFWKNIAIICSVTSFTFMSLAVIGVWKKDTAANYLGMKNVKIRFKDFFEIIKHNRAIQMLVIAAASDKLAFSLSGAVGIYLFQNILMNTTLAGIMSVVGMPFTIFFVLLATAIGRKTTQKRAFITMTWIAMTTALLAIFMFPKIGASATSIPVIVFFAIYLIQKGAAAASGGFVTTMIADCSDYETYLNGKAVPGMMGTLFSFVDKMVSSINGLIISLMFGLFGLANTVIEPLTPASDYGGLSIIIVFGLFVMPIFGNICSVISMKFYPLTKEKMVEIQKVIQLYKKQQSDPRSDSFIEKK
ncbi:MAG: MFS transporter [Mycoplasmatales bacterium]